LQMLAGYGVDYAQGFHVGAPAEAPPPCAPAFSPAVGTARAWQRPRPDRGARPAYRS
jgi:EAL domain-containing protein (putative c-di-GMP-specific phosphodiesterase class I)